MEWLHIGYATPPSLFRFDSSLWRYFVELYFCVIIDDCLDIQMCVLRVERAQSQQCYLLFRLTDNYEMS